MASKGRLVWYGLGGLGGAALLTGAYYAGLRQVFEAADSASAFGDAFGGLSAVLSALATIGVVVTLAQQQDQMKLQREALNAQLEALTAQREELALQRQELALQRDEMARSGDALGKSADAHSRQIEVMRESAQAARAQVVASGLAGIERFLSRVRELLVSIGDSAELLRAGYTYASAEKFYDYRMLLGKSKIKALSSQVPSTMIFGPSADVLERANDVRIALNELIGSVLECESLYQEALSGPYPNKREMAKLSTKAEHFGDVLLPRVHRLVVEFEKEAAHWFARTQEQDRASAESEGLPTRGRKHAS